MEVDVKRQCIWVSKCQTIKVQTRIRYWCSYGGAAFISEAFFGVIVEVGDQTKATCNGTSFVGYPQPCDILVHASNEVGRTHNHQYASDNDNVDVTVPVIGLLLWWKHWHGSIDGPIHAMCRGDK